MKNIMKKLNHFLVTIVFLAITSSCTNMGLYESMEFEDESGNELITNHKYAGFYSLINEGDSTINLGIHNSIEFEDGLEEIRISHAYGHFYSIEVKDTSGNYIPDHKYERLIKKNVRKMNEK